MLGPIQISAPCDETGINQMISRYVQLPWSSPKPPSWYRKWDLFPQVPTPLRKRPWPRQGFPKTSLVTLLSQLGV